MIILVINGPNLNMLGKKFGFLRIKSNFPKYVW